MLHFSPFQKTYSKNTPYKHLLLNFLSIRWVRFGLVGGIATLIYFICGLFFVNILDFSLLIGNGLAYLIGFIFSYSGQKKWTFESRGKVKTSLPKFAIAQAAGLGLNSLIVKTSVNLGMSYETSMIIATALVPLAVYFLCKFWVFRNN